jgi:hypothetical protein
MSLLLAVFELRDHRGLDGDRKAEAIDAAPAGAEAQRRMAAGRLSCFARNGRTGVPARSFARGGKPRGRKSHRRHCGSGDRGAAGLRPDQANERPGARVRRTAFRRRASHRSAHTRDLAFPAKGKETWGAERRPRLLRNGRKPAHGPATTGLQSAEEINRLNRSMRQDRDVAVTNDDQISALIPTEKRRTVQSPSSGRRLDRRLG